jgi:DNA-binding transcriptional MerR regulator
MRVKEVADLVGISVRTLHHYDEIGLLTPDHVTESGYRLYSEGNLEVLQQILFFKELGFPLKKISEIIHSPTFDKNEALQVHKTMLLERRKRLDGIITLVERTIQHAQGEINMSNDEKFVGFTFDSNPYEQEARERWGNTAVDDSKRKIEQLDHSAKDELSHDMNEIYRKLAAIRDISPHSDEAQRAIKEWYDFLNKMGAYSPEAFRYLGIMYVEDERFTKNIDQFGPGLSQFMCDAMSVFADNYKPSE